MGAFLSRLTAHDRASEAMVGLLVALAARGTVRIASPGHDADAQVLALASLGATLAWAIIDAALFMLAAKGSRLRWMHVTRNDDPASPAARRWIEESISQSFFSGLDAATKERIRDDLVAAAARAPASDPRLSRSDWLAGLAILAVVLLAGLPSILPLLLLPDLDAAVWTSYGVAILMLFGLGAHWGPAHGLPRLRSGLAMLAIGAALTVVMLALGG